MSKISALPELNTPADDDYLEIVDVSDTSQAPTGTNKKIPKADLVASAPPAAHATEHQNGGTDEIDVTGLSGLLADPQVADKAIESGGPTTLDFGAIVDGEFLKRVGTEIVSDTAGGGGPATQIDETGGPTTLDIAGIADGQFLKRSGTDIVGDAPTASIAPFVIESANVVAQRNGATGQTLNIYSSFTDASNYDRLRVGFNSPNMEISVEKAGTGTQRSLSIKVGSTFLLFDGSRLYPSDNKTMDLGFPSGNWFGAGNFNECRVSSSVRWENGLKVTEGGTGSGNNNILKIAGDFRGGGTFSGGNETASQFTANQNNLSVLGYYMQRWSSDASRDVTGMTAAGNVAEMVLLIVNVGANDIVLKHENASSIAANRFLCSTGADIPLSANQAAEAIYDSTSQRWRVFKRN